MFLFSREASDRQNQFFQMKLHNYVWLFSDNNSHFVFNNDDNMNISWGLNKACGNRFNIQLSFQSSILINYYRYHFCFYHHCYFCFYQHCYFCFYHHCYFFSTCEQRIEMNSLLFSDNDHFTVRQNHTHPEPLGA